MTSDGSLEVCRINGSDSDFRVTGTIPAKSSMDDVTAVGAGREGLLCRDGRYLYEWDGADGEHKALFGWSDPYINIVGSQVMGCGRLSEDRYLVLLGNLHRTQYEYALVSKRQVKDLPVRETVTMGVSYPYSKAGTEIVQQFNRNSTGYQIQLVYYEDDSYVSARDKLDRDIISGEGPDLFDLSYMHHEDYTEKGVLEDLAPYFAESETVSKEDLLSCIWASGERGGKMSVVIPSFTLSAPRMLRSAAGEDGGITLRELREIQEKNPEIPFRNSYSFYDDLEYCISSNMDSFVDAENGQCFFTGEEFRSLVEWLNGMPRSMEHVENNGSRMVIHYSPDDVLDGKYLIERDRSLISIMDYREQVKRASQTMSYVGYPSRDGSLKTQINPNGVYGMNHNSEKKDGAWSFLEYLLSEQYQREQVGNFPVRKAF